MRTSLERILDGENISRVVRETAATPMFKGLTPKLGTLTKSLKFPTMKSQISGLMPTAGTQGSSFASESLEHDIETSASATSPSGAGVDRSLLTPGAQIGIRGPRHNGHHAVVAADDHFVTLKNRAGREETLPMASLKDHEVIHALEMV